MNKAQRRNAYFQKDSRIKSVSDILPILAKAKSHASPIWFRGHGSIDWKLVPSICRSGGEKAEIMFLKRFKQHAFRLLDRLPNSEWEWLFLMQHYRVPTRLLDWTEHPLVGLYFTVSDKGLDTEDGVLWGLDPIALNKNAGIELRHNMELPLFDEQDGNPLRNYLPSIVATEQSTKLQPVAGLAVHNSSRIAAQLGVFTITHRDQSEIDKVNNGKFVCRIIVPARQKSKIREELSLFKISPFTLFPELESASICVTEGV